MFYGCSNLNYIKCLAKEIDPDSISDWLSGVASSGVFVKASSMEDWPSGSSGIPEGWTIIDSEEQAGNDVFNNFKKYLTLTSEEETTINFTLSYDTGSLYSPEPWLFYSYDTESWKTWDYNNHNYLTFSNEKPLYICGYNPDGFNREGKSYSFKAIGSKFEVSGDIMSLIDYCDEVESIPCISCFERLFEYCDLLTSASELTATTLAKYCYRKMFNGCTNLKSIKCLVENINPDDGCFEDWVAGVDSSGTFIKSPSMTDWPRGSSGIPNYWRIINDTSN
jgi:hypothetical protein